MGLKEELVKSELCAGKFPILGNCRNISGVNERDVEGVVWFAVVSRLGDESPFWRSGNRLFTNKFCDVIRLFWSRSCAGSLSFLFLRGGREVVGGINEAPLLWV